MKRFASLLLSSLLAATPAWSQSATDAPLMGTWAVDVARLPTPPQSRPQRVHIRFSGTPRGELSTVVEVLDASGTPLRVEGTATLDGTPAPTRGNLEADMAAASMPAPGVLVLQLAKGGAPVSTRIYSVAPDGQSMVETVAYYAPDGRPMLRTNHFSRVR